MLPAITSRLPSSQCFSVVGKGGEKNFSKKLSCVFVSFMINEHEQHGEEGRKNLHISRQNIYKEARLKYLRRCVS